MRRTLRLCLTAAIVVTLAPPATAASAAGDDISAPPTIIEDAVPGGFRSWDELFEVQGRMNTAAALIRDTATKGGISGFGSAIAAPERRHLVIYWRGAVPAEMRAAFEQARTLIPITLLPAKYTENELIHATERLSRMADIVEAGPLPDASGLLVRRRPVGDSTVQQNLIDLGVDIREVSEAGERIPFSRQDDSWRYFAGARMVSCSTCHAGPVAQQYGCTTGFPVHHGGTTKLLTAGHCGDNGDPMWDGGGDFMGYIQGKSYSRDIALVNVEGYGRMWDGGVQSTYTKAIQSAKASEIANWLCTSGSRSGVRCNIQVRAINQNFGGVFPLVKAERNDRLNAAGTRDSGGPVFSLPSPDNGKVIAMGLINSGDTSTQVTCTGENWTGRMCTWRFYYSDITQTMAYYGASIVTS